MRLKTQNSNVKCQNFGFTLIEILVALTITSLVFAGGYTGYREFVRREALNNAYRGVVTNFNLASQRALSGEKPAGCTATLRGYRIELRETRYTVSAVCDSTTIEVRNIELPEGITISGPSQILYKVLGQGTDLSSDTTITLTQEGTGRTVEANLSTEGTLKLK